jgi:hypothetical protein
MQPSVDLYISNAAMTVFIYAAEKTCAIDIDVFVNVTIFHRL